MRLATCLLAFSLIIFLTNADVVQITQEIVSDTSTNCRGPSRTGACVASYVHPIWSANIPGATWIWETNFATAPAVTQTVDFTKHFYIGGVPTKGTLYIANDDYFDAWVNGERVACAAYNTFTLTTQQVCDVTAALEPGLNTLRINVRNLGWTTRAWDNPGGILYKLVFSSNLAI